MEKPKRAAVVPEMRARLLTNRTGRMLPSQWIDIATGPVLSVLILAGLALLVFGPRFAVAAFRSWTILAFVMLTLVVIPIVLRSVRYARAPVHFARMEAAGEVASWFFWRRIAFRDANGERMDFTRRLAPRAPLRTGGDYLVYYLDDPTGRVLLSYAPADHPDADGWTPTESFQWRFQKRKQS